MVSHYRTILSSFFLFLIESYFICKFIIIITQLIKLIKNALMRLNLVELLKTNTNQEIKETLHLTNLQLIYLSIYVVLIQIIYNGNKKHT